MSKSIHLKILASSLAMCVAVPVPFVSADIGLLTKDQAAAGAGQFQSTQPNSPPSSNASGNSSKPPSPYRVQSGATTTSCDDDVVGSVLGGLAFVLIGGAANRVYKIVDPPGISWWREREIQREFQFSPMWYFESRSKQQYSLGQASGTTSHLDWSGSPGFQMRFANQPLLRLGSEFIFDFVQHGASVVDSGATEFTTHPRISFSNSSVTAERNSELAVGQINFLLRETPYTFAFAGLRWWHQGDQVTLKTVSGAETWENQLHSEAPYFQFGGQIGSMGTRWMWINRIGVGFGANRNSSRTTASQYVGASPIASNQTNFSALIDGKSEFAFAVTDQLSLRFGTQLVGVSGRARSADQMEFTNLSTREARLRTESVLLSAIYIGLSYQF